MHIRRPASAPNGCVKRPVSAVSFRVTLFNSVCSVCAGVRRRATLRRATSPPPYRAPRGRAECCVRVVFRRASSRFAAYRTVSRESRSPFLFQITTRPGPRAARSSRRIICGAAGAFDNGRALSRLPQWSKTPSVLNGARPPRPPAGVRGVLHLRPPDPQVVVFDPEMDLEYTLPRESKRPADARPSEARPPTRTPTPDRVILPITRVSPRSGDVEPLKGLNPKRHATQTLTGLRTIG
ncbi:hypothetical protein EVAR_35734_1 [Eumeta japonica]|uniref:Uncharacterized protein n=1 Tax=Eumeta variegata TaxID=151549 RepID=A0A4C1VFE3_EUMVA|nr:hypothetical protein EVAR_35734_1 [Eumeta japonica]